MGGGIENRGGSVTQGLLADGGDPARVTALASRLGLPVLAAADEAEVVLAVCPGGLELRHTGKPPVVARCEPQRIRAPGRDDPLLRAVGRGVREVIDATAGLGTDAVRLARAGYRVRALERTPLLAVLFADALGGEPGDCFRLDGGEITVECADARERLPELAPVEAVYLDPMYPPKRKLSALPRKEVRLLRALVGDDPDADELLAAALRAASRRVVVKRPQHAPPLEAAGAKPTGSVSGKLVRYDLYAPAASDDHA